MPSHPLEGFARITLPANVASAIAAHAVQCAPEECCGLLLGSLEAIREHVPTPNAAADRRRQYLIDPVDHFAAIRSARDRGLEVIGAYHSHPTGPATPSQTDLEESFSGFLFLIVGMGELEPAITAWERRAGNFIQVPLVRMA